MRSKKILSALATLGLLATWVMPVAAQSDVSNSVNQATAGFIINGGFQEGELEDNAFQNATGSVGMNNAAGSLNQQANQLYINQTTTELNFNSQNTQDQFGSSVDLVGFDSSGNNEATYEDHAFQHASGNIGANNAGGNLNQQQNTAAIFSSCNNQCGNGPEVNSGTITVDQSTGGLGLDGSHFNLYHGFIGSDGTNTASYEDSAFAGASGNIGTNNAAGNMNQQANQLVLLTNGEMESLLIGLSQDNTGSGGVSNSVVDGTGNSVANDTHNVALFDGSFSSASGNIGVNNAAGDMNQQANQAMLNVAAVPAPTATQPPEGFDPFTTIDLSLTQTSTGSVTNAGEQEAEFEGNAFTSATGNIGVNNAAGTLNQQENQLYLDVLAEETGFSVEHSQSQSEFTVDPSGWQHHSAGNNEATVEDNAFQTATGNIGMNNAAGNGNQQQNGSAIFANTCVASCGGATELQGPGYDSAVSISQDSEDNTYVGVADRYTSEPANGNNSAIFEDNAFQAATGNIGANNASGNMNQQGNQLVLVTNGEFENIGYSVEQGAFDNTVAHDTQNVANFDGHAFANASGNVGVNNAAGDMNQQANLAVINRAATGPTTPQTPEGPDDPSIVNNSLSQLNLDATIADAGNQEAEFEGSAFANATGNIGVNNAGGTENQQANALYIDRLAQAVDLTEADTQLLGGGYMVVGDASGNQEATIEDNVFSHATGNIGVNNAGGNANQQENSTLILQNVCGDPGCGQGPQVTGGDVRDGIWIGGSASLDIEQEAGFNIYDGGNSATPLESEGNNQATFEDNAFQNASGNIGVNNAAGNMNQQSNMMVLVTNGTLSSLSAHIGQIGLNGVANDTGNIANYQGNAFQNASGNVSANNAAGDLNQQANQTIINTKP